MKKIDVNFLEPSQQQLDILLKYYQAGRYIDAEKLSLSITQEFPKHPFAWKVLAIVLKQNGRISESLVASQKSVQLDPQDAGAHLNFGVILQELGRLKEAEASYGKAIELKPDYAEAYYNLGVILQGLERLEEAETSYRKAIELKPDYAKAHSNLGNTLKELGRLDEAGASYNQAIALKPDYAEAHNNLGVMLQELEKLEGAETSFRKAIVLKPDLAEAHNNLGIILKKQGRLDEAEKSFSRAIELKPYYKSALLNMGMIQFNKNKFELSLRNYDLCDNEESRGYALSCLYNLGRIQDIYKRIEKNCELDDKNIRVAAFSSFISKKEKKETAHKFCNNPIDFINISNLSSYLKNSNLFINEVIEELKTIDTVWEDKTTYNGFHSVNRINIFENPLEKLKNLKLIIVDEIDAYYSRFKNENCSYIKKWPSKKNIGGWYIILKQQGFQKAHIHPSGWLSGAIYLRVAPHLEKNEGAIEFSLNGWGYSDLSLPKKILNPKEGDMVLFPSSLHHGTIPYSTDTDRIVISFDLMPKIIDNNDNY
jgi:tetratricopeptide (TPR) repeat protein